MVKIICEKYCSTELDESIGIFPPLCLANEYNKPKEL